MHTFLSWLTHPITAWFAAAIIGGAIGAFVNGMVGRRLRRVGRVQFLRTRIVALNPRNRDSLASNSFFLELRMQNTSDEPRVVESPLITFNCHKRGIGMKSGLRLESPSTTFRSNDLDIDGLNIPFRLLDEEGKPLEYVVLPARELKVVRVRINTETFDFAGVPKPRRDANEDLGLAFQASHVFIHFRYPGNKHLESQVIIDVTERQGWEYQCVVYFPDESNASKEKVSG